VLSQCLSGNCVDAFCCDTACTGTCMTCALTMSLGKCSYTPAGKPDANALMPCSGLKTCDGAGSCAKALGEACTAGSECGSGYCVDGYCCDGACTTACKSCAVSGSLGTCSNVAAGLTDASATTPCTGTKACDGKGGCMLADGQACKADAECGNGHCVDGYCCESACTEKCRSCAVTGSLGKCAYLSLGQTDTFPFATCDGTKVCDGKGGCKLADGETCANDSGCASDICVDQTCCKTECTKTCQSCAVSGSKGTCTYITQGQDPDGECIGKHTKCGGACDGKGQCEFPGVGTICGLCKACDGTGSCNSKPTDDDNCGTIDCDKLDTSCVDYHDIKTERCDSFGYCKVANQPGTCTKFTKLACSDAGVDSGAPDSGAPDKGAPDAPGWGDSAAADVTASPDGSSTTEAESGGCSCEVAGAPTSPAIPAVLSLILLGLRRRR
jgi:MYXO-CTERM domain-containing protein